MMTQELSNKTLMLSVIAAFQVGNLEPLFAALSPDVVWKATAPREFFRFGGTHRGIAGMREYTALLFSRYSFTRFTPKTLTAKGDQVWGVFEAEALHQPSQICPVRHLHSLDGEGWQDHRASGLFRHRGRADAAG